MFWRWTSQAPGGKRVIQLRHQQPSLWEEAQGKRHGRSRTRGRRQTPAEVALRMLILKHVRNWSYEMVEREVRANVVPCLAFPLLADREAHKRPSSRSRTPAGIFRRTRDHFRRRWFLGSCRPPPRMLMEWHRSEKARFSSRTLDVFFLLRFESVLTTVSSNKSLLVFPITLTRDSSHRLS